MTSVPYDLPDLRPFRAIQNQMRLQGGAVVTQNGSMESDDFVTGVSGWQINGVGNSEFNNVTVRGTIGGSTLGGALVVGASGTIQSSNFSTGVAGWQINGGGSAELNNVTVRGTIGAATAAAALTVGNAGTIKSNNYVAGSSGWQIDGLGNVDFNDGTFRGAIVTDSVTITVVSGGVEKVRLDSTGLTVADGSITVGGGPVRALSVGYVETSQTNATLSTNAAAPTEMAVATITPPAWATTVFVQAVVMFQVTNTSGAGQSMHFRAAIHAVPSSGTYTNTQATGAIDNVTDVYARTMVKGTDFTADIYASGFLACSAANAANLVRTKVTLFYLR